MKGDWSIRRMDNSSHSQLVAGKSCEDNLSCEQFVAPLIDRNIISVKKEMCLLEEEESLRETKDNFIQKKEKYRKKFILFTKIHSPLVPSSIRSDQRCHNHRPVA